MPTRLPTRPTCSVATRLAAGNHEASRGDSTPLPKEYIAITNNLATLLRPGALSAATLETPAFRFQLAPEGRYEILDKQAKVTWRSNPYQPRFGEATIRVGGPPRRVTQGAQAQVARWEPSGSDLLVSGTVDVGAQENWVWQSGVRTPTGATAELRGTRVTVTGAVKVEVWSPYSTSNVTV